MALIRPCGSGPERLEPPSEWPSTPVLIVAPTGSGRRTWADHLMRSHRAKAALTWRSPEDRAITAEQARHLSTDHFRVRTREPKWASICLDGASLAAQNALLKVLEELPAHARVVLRARPSGALPTIRSRCITVNLRPGTAQEECDLIEASGIEEDDALILQAARPGRPGAAIALADALPARNRAQDLLGAAEARDPRAIAQSLREFEPGTELWLAEWCRSAQANRPDSHHALARECQPLLSACLRTLATVGNHRLAARQALMTITNRPEA